MKQQSENKSAIESNAGAMALIGMVWIKNQDATQWHNAAASLMGACMVTDSALSAELMFLADVAEYRARLEVSQ